MVFGPLGLLRPGPIVEMEGLRLPLPRAADLMVEKLLTDRTGEKGARDLLVVAGMLVGVTPADLDEFVVVTRGVSAESRHAICSGLTVLSLMEVRPGMPDPAPVRDQVRRPLSRIEEQPTRCALDSRVAPPDPRRSRPRFSDCHLHRPQRVRRGTSVRPAADSESGDPSPVRSLRFNVIRPRNVLTPREAAR
jgi:hypothetical protein